MLTDTQAEALELALAQESEYPALVPENITDIPHFTDLPEDVVLMLRDTDINDPAYKLYLAWRRFSAVRLKGQGFTYAEIAARLGVSEGVIGADLKRVRSNYDNMARKDWALLVEDRICQIDQDIAYLRRLIDKTSIGDIDQKLRIFDRITAAEARRDKILGLDKAAASQHVEKKAMVVQLSFNNDESGFVDASPVIEVDAID